MYIFLDESGVHKQEGKSSIALVYLSVKNLSSLEKLVIDTEEKIKIENFHWSHNGWIVRNKFVEAISKGDFSIKVALVQNPFRAEHAYEFVLQHLVVEKEITSLIIDGKKGKIYERKLKNILRSKGIPIKKLKTANDESYPVLRVADAVAGLVRLYNQNPNNTNIKNLYNKIAKKIVLTLID